MSISSLCMSPSTVQFESRNEQCFITQIIFVMAPTHPPVLLTYTDSNARWNPVYNSECIELYVNIATAHISPTHPGSHHVYEPSARGRHHPGPHGHGRRGRRGRIQAYRSISWSSTRSTHTTSQSTLTSSRAFVRMRFFACTSMHRCIGTKPVCTVRVCMCVPCVYVYVYRVCMFAIMVMVIIIVIRLHLHSGIRS